MWYLDLVFLAVLAFGFLLIYVFINWCGKQIEKK